MPIFLELSLILILAAAISFIMRLLHQPLIVGYILTGILIGPYAFNVLHSKEELELFSKIGISILLFIVGLGLNPGIIREVGKTSFITGVGQVLFTSFLGYWIVLALGYSPTAALYTSIALTFSSTIIILKLLTDRGDTGRLYGKISIGFLLVQDLIATFILLGVTIVGALPKSTIDTALTTALGTKVALLILGAVALAMALYFASKYILPRIISYAGGNQEVLFIFSLAWGLGLASIFQLSGFSIEIGALVAGVTLALSPFAYEIGSRMKPLRDFFILIFFVLLGAHMILNELTVIILPALILSLFVLIGNPLIVFVLMNLLGYRSKTAFMAGLTVAQISEFSLILVSLGLSLGHIEQEVVSLVTLVGIITIAGSTYLILYADKLYAVLANGLEYIAFRKHHHREPVRKSDAPDIVIFGYDRVGNEFVEAAQKVSPKFFVVDYDPNAIRILQQREIPFRYGDANDVEFLNEIGVPDTRLIVSTIPDHNTNMLLARLYRKHNKTGVFVTLAHEIAQARDLYAAGATYVVMPHHLGAHHAALMIARHGLSPHGFTEERNIHLSRLERRIQKDGVVQ